MEFTITDVRECARQLRSVEVKSDAGGNYWFPVSEEVATLYFINRNFPSWLQYV